MERQECAILSITYFELMEVLEQLADAAEIPPCTIELLEKARKVLERQGLESRLDIIIKEIKKYNSQVRKALLYHELWQAMEDIEEAEQHRAKFMEYAEETNIMRLKLASFILDTMKLIAEKAEEC